MTRRTALQVMLAAVTASLAACALVPGAQLPGLLGNGGTQVNALSEPDEVVLVGAGDIAYDSPGAEATAKLLDKLPGIVFTLGDNAYQNGSAAEYQKHYHPTWGRHKERTRPVVGNHEYRTPDASGYYDYFGAAAGDRKKGFYAYDANAKWRVYVINSCEGGTDHASEKHTSMTSEQYQWLSADLDANKAKNTVVMWHHPTFSTGAHGDNDETRSLWRLAYMKGVDIALWGHDHHYERFYPMDGDGRRDDLNGVRSWVVGTGGKNHYRFFKFPKKTTAVRNADTFGVLRLTLRTKSYEWEFVPEAGKDFKDSGRSLVH